MHLSLKSAVDAWAKAARLELAKLDERVKNARADLAEALENHAKLSAELAIYEAKKETL
jgi:hypothetical protein